MKANIKNLKQFLSICAKAHNAKFHDWSNAGSLSIQSETPATICDVQMILDAFYGKHYMVETGWGHTIIWLDRSLPTHNDVDLQLCALALPYGTKLA